MKKFVLVICFLILLGSIASYLFSIRQIDSNAVSAELVNETSSIDGNDDYLLQREAFIRNLNLNDAESGEAFFRYIELPVEGIDIFNRVKGEPQLLSALKSEIQSRHLIELFSLEKIRTSDITSKLSKCSSSNCYKIQFFNYATNSSTVVIYDKSSDEILDIKFLNQIQIEIPEHLKKLALNIIISSKKVREELGQYKISAEDFLMSNTKTALNNTKCERSNHLCVAPTYATKSKAFWSIVDLTDLRLVGTAWTKWNGEVEFIPTEQNMAFQAIQANECDKIISKKIKKWSFDHSLTGSDGVNFSDIKYDNNLIIKSFKNVDWHVSYSGTNGFGYSDAIGCPLFSTAAIVPATMTEVVEDKDLVRIRQDFRSKYWPRPCNYFYRQEVELLDSAEIRLKVANVGRGCGDNGTYRPVVRVHLNASKISKIIGSKEIEIRKEEYLNFNMNLDGEIESLLVYDRDGKKHRVIADKSHVYLTKYHMDIDEGEGDLPTIGPCCNTDSDQGPDKFINDEEFGSNDLVLWFAFEMKNNGSVGSENCWADTQIVDGITKIREFPCESSVRIIRLEE